MIERVTSEAQQYFCDTEGLPVEFDSPARGEFPTLEKALGKRGVQIPGDWSVSRFMAVTLVESAQLIREDSGLPDKLPEQVRLSTDNGCKSGPTVQNMVYGEVVFEDEPTFYGAVRTPDHSIVNTRGIPSFCWGNKV